MEFIVHDNFLGKKCFSFYSLCLLFKVARAKLQKLFFTNQKALYDKPVAENIQYPSYFGYISNTDVGYASNSDYVWFILQSSSPQSSHKIPTWAAQNSLLT